ncbi:hypothetical protein [Oceanibacterium hippocampi]|uniref:Uncharacterized protein n=1 Tax=Oceanibacterium hippocampi TaxID=745714 RepID=A0A1Y5SCX5_9PROT|nr:hypothetical protein [Oceanibacterium hippocampi]SLN37905.1 hypothetical protein OCH7691_01552 [Oceanibacterium hippocampi]
MAPDPAPANRPISRRKRRAITLAAALAVSCALPLPAAPASAEPVTRDGLTFSDELGGFRILSLSGIGSLEDPFVLVEEMTTLGEIALVIRGLASRSQLRPNRFSSITFAGFHLVKVVINRSGREWASYEHELREDLAEPSSYGDGLSFDQPKTGPRPFESDRFQRSHEVTEPADLVRFDSGRVAVGEAATFRYVITDASPLDRFYLLQRPAWPIAARR